MALVCSAVFTRLMSENKTNDILQRKWLTYKIFVSHSTKFLHCCVNDIIILIQINKETKEINCHPKCLHHLVQCFCIVMSIILFWCKLVHTLHSPFFFIQKYCILTQTFIMRTDFCCSAVAFYSHHPLHMKKFQKSKQRHFYVKLLLKFD